MEDDISTHSLTKRLTTTGKVPAWLYFVFQLTASRRGWRTASRSWQCTEWFQLTASRRGWHRCWPLWVLRYLFQLTASRRGWPHPLVLLSVNTHYFNSQPHEEADYTSVVWTMKRNYFNSQPHEEADPLCVNSPSWQRNISTHSLTKRLTKRVHYTFDAIIVFQLTASRRGWRAALSALQEICSFQLTASRRGWRQIRHINLHLRRPFQLTASRRGWRGSTLRAAMELGNFNSQPHEEADSAAVIPNCSDFISTHSLTKRLTIWSGLILLCFHISTHSLTKRLTKKVPNR